MKKLLYLSVFLLISFISVSEAQIICIFCYNQTDSISDNVNNLILNGSFENHNCVPDNWFSSSYCPNSSYYSCDIANWTCIGGGPSTYADVTDINYSEVADGSYTVYFGSYYCNACSSTQNDTSCLTSTDCTMGGIPSGFPTNDPAYGGSQGLSLEQTVSGLTVGATYILEFWAGGEGQPEPGLFAVDVGFGNTFLRNYPTQPGIGIGIRYIIEFNATSTSHTIKFTNWGHICAACTELILDDVKLYTLAELSPNVPPCAGANVTAVFTAPNHICPGTCTNFTNLSVNATSYQWSFPGGNPSVSTDVNPSNICYNTPGSYDVTLIANGLVGGDTLTLPNYITVYPWPAAQGISQSGDTLFANQGAVSYQWYENGNLIPGATNYFYVALESGNYNVVATDNNNCEVEAAVFDVLAGVNQFAKENGPAIFPNPAKDKLEIRNLESEKYLIVKIYNKLGTLMTVPEMTLSSQGNKHFTGVLDISELSSGTYIIEITSKEKIFRNQFIKQ